ncbi:uncharacterized protein C3orf20 homolog [Heteronotia binoei]|uniref:uncharacterized protein C3orf20 homolog n=1 Tax=Heteronotia binoei TaxID=13085 RepID=UPI00292CB0E7|nr:uncharacterized protein C3orf20 homolog [Heteronotia binoei]
MSTHKKNLEYELMKAKAPGILSEMAHMLVTWRKMGFHVPRGVKNVFEFTWEELLASLPRKSFSGIYCPVVKFSPHEDFSVPTTAASKIHKPGVTISGIKPTYVTPSVDSQQQMLLKFQQRSVHLLSELLKMKMKIMINAVAGPSAEEIARRLLEGGHQLNPKNQEEAFDFMTKDPKKKGGRTAVPMVPAIPINSTTLLIQQVSYSCLCFSLALKDSKQSKGVGENPLLVLDRSARQGAGKRRASQDAVHYDERLDPCPEAREKLREICQRIEEEKAFYKAKGYTRPLTLRHYPVIIKTPSAAMKRGASSSSATFHEPKPHKKSKKFHYAFPDGTSFIFYPSGNIAIYQFPVCCIGKTITLLYHDARSSALLGTFISYGQSCVHYSFKTRCSLALLMTQDGGTVRDQFGILTHQWSWYSKQQILQSLEFQINEQVKLKVLSLQSMTLSFTSHNETITVSVSSTTCPHESKTEKRTIAKASETEDEGQWTRIIADSKRRFERIVKQFANAILLTAGICCVDYPLGESSKQVRFKTREPSPQAWERKFREETIALPEAEMKPRPKIPMRRSTVYHRTLKEKIKTSSQDKAEAGGETQLQSPWATSPADCPIVLRKIMAKEEDIVGCKCVVKIPSITDLEFEKFVAAPRDRHQILVICVLSSKTQSYSPFFEWSLEKIYIEMQHGRASPCIQCKHDPFRFLKYDLDSPVNKKPPLLIQKHGVIPGMVVMYSGGKPVFGGCVFNGYSYSKKDFLKQVRQARLDCKMGHFLPQSFKFSSPSVLCEGTRKVQSTLSKPGLESCAAESSVAENKKEPSVLATQSSSSVDSKKASSVPVTQSRVRGSLGDEELLVDATKVEEEKPKRATSGRKKTKK